MIFRAFIESLSTVLRKPPAMEAILAFNRGLREDA